VTDELPHFIERLTGHRIRSTTDEGAVLELMDAFGMLPSRDAGTRDYDAEASQFATPDEVDESGKAKP
jgi:hypothetical protein